MASDVKSDRRPRRIRRLIVDALLALMLEKRFERITVQEIIERADVGRSTFYAQFRNKEDVLERELARVFDKLHEQHAASETESADRLLPSQAHFHHILETQPFYPTRIRGLARDPHYEAVHRALRDKTARRLAAVSESRNVTVPLDTIADFLAGAFLTFVHSRLDRGMAHTPEQMEEIFQELVMPGVRAVLTSRPR